jgi:hypothetical protein
VRWLRSRCLDPTRTGGPGCGVRVGRPPGSASRRGSPSAALGVVRNMPAGAADRIADTSAEQDGPSARLEGYPSRQDEQQSPDCRSYECRDSGWEEPVGIRRQACQRSIRRGVAECASPANCDVDSRRHVTAEEPTNHRRSDSHCRRYDHRLRPSALSTRLTLSDGSGAPGAWHWARNSSRSWLPIITHQVAVRRFSP